MTSDIDLLIEDIKLDATHVRAVIDIIESNQQRLLLEFDLIAEPESVSYYLTLYLVFVCYGTDVDYDMAVAKANIITALSKIGFNSLRRMNIINTVNMVKSLLSDIERITPVKDYTEAKLINDGYIKRKRRYT
jgi:hypothetical protein